MTRTSIIYTGADRIYDIREVAQWSGKCMVCASRKARRGLQTCAYCSEGAYERVVKRRAIVKPGYCTRCVYRRAVRGRKCCDDPVCRGTKAAKKKKA